MSGLVVILGVFVADTTYRADRLPVMGETILGKSFALGPGGKGSNQAVACALAGGDAQFITKLGTDPFAELAFETWKRAGVVPQVTQHDDGYTGAACIYVGDDSGENAIIVCPGVARTISPEYIDSRAILIGGADVFITQLEQPINAAVRALEIAKAGGATTILNPAPAARLADEMLALCDFVTPNETEASGLTGLSVTTVEEAREAAELLLARGAGAVIITLGEAGALLHGPTQSVHVPAFDAGPVMETTGAGDAFNGGFASALARDVDPVDAVRFGCAAAAISVTRPGTASAMPTRKEIEQLLAEAGPSG